MRVASADPGLGCAIKGEVPEGYAEVQQDSPFLAAFGAMYYKPKAGGAFVGCWVLPQHINRYGILHGGALAAFIDMALGRAVLVHPELPFANATVSLHIDFMAPGQVGEWLEAEVTLPKFGKRLAFASCEVRADGRPIAGGRGVFSLRRP